MIALFLRLARGVHMMMFSWSSHGHNMMMMVMNRYRNRIGHRRWWGNRYRRWKHRGWQMRHMGAWMRESASRHGNRNRNHVRLHSPSDDGPFGEFFQLEHFEAACGEAQISKETDEH